jgi:hypothetical protein
MIGSIVDLDLQAQCCRTIRVAYTDISQGKVEGGGIDLDDKLCRSPRYQRTSRLPIDGDDSAGRETAPACDKAQDMYSWSVLPCHRDVLYD